jgi:HKD family nuclease
VKRIISQPDSDVRLGDELLKQLHDERWTEFRGAVAFVKLSGVKHLREALTQFSKRAQIRLTVGVDMGGTTFEGLAALLQAVGDNQALIVFHNENPSTFHPKTWLFRNTTEAILISGSGNLTEGGLFTNYEIALAVHLDLSGEDDAALLSAAEAAFTNWEGAAGTALPLNGENLTALRDAGYLPSEEQARKAITAADGQPGIEIDAPAPTKLFKRAPIKKAPFIATPAPAQAGVAEDAAAVVAEAAVEAIASDVLQTDGRGFLMTLQQTDVGTGQTTPGTLARSPEIFIPLAARNHRPDFWQWPDGFVEDPNRPGKFDRRGVPMRIGGSTVEVNMFVWPVKHDFRLRSEALRSAGSVGDILRIERASDGAPFEYYVEIVPQGTSEYQKYLAQCANPVRNSAKRWGYY